MTWGMIRDGALLLQGGKVLEMGPSRRLENLTVARGAREIDAAGRVVLPGFVDGRTQPLIPEVKSGPAATDATWPVGGTDCPAFGTATGESSSHAGPHGASRHDYGIGVTTPSLDRSAALKTLRIFAGAEGKH